MTNHPVLTGDAEVLQNLRQAIISGQPWYTALLKAVRRWAAADETYNDHTYRYLIAGEAFDWLLLAERLCQAVDCWPPGAALDTLLFHGKLPLNLSSNRFKELIGSAKYRKYLNYFYGVTVEEVLILAVQAEIRKEMQTSGRNQEPDYDREVYRRIYGATKTELLRCFRREQGYRQLKSTSLTEIKEFTYWLFKYRLRHCDKARVASDTKKALQWLQAATGRKAPG